jgi:hypothetical protein
MSQSTLWVDIRFWHLADITVAPPNVAFGSKADFPAATEMSAYDSLTPGAWSSRALAAYQSPLPISGRNGGTKTVSLKFNRLFAETKRSYMRP